MPNYPYKSLGTDLNRDFRNDLNENFKGVESDLRDMQTNFNEVVETVSEKAFDKVVDAAKIDWLSPVNTFNDLSTTYPDAIEGKTSMARDSGKIYRFNGTEWIEIQDIDPTAINEVDSRLSAQLADIATLKPSGKTDDTDYNNIQNAINNSKYVKLAGGVFNITKQINLPSNDPVSIEGAGVDKTVLKALTSDISVFKKDNNQCLGSSITNLTIDGNLKAAHGLELISSKQFKLNRIRVINCLDDMILLGGDSVNMFYESQISEVIIEFEQSNSADLRPNYGIHFLVGGHDSNIDTVVIKNVKLAGIKDDEQSNNMYSKIHSYGYPEPDYRTQYAMDVYGSVFIEELYADSAQTAGIKIRGTIVTVINSLFFWSTSISTAYAYEVNDGGNHLVFIGNQYQNMQPSSAINFLGEKGSDLFIVARGNNSIPGALQINQTTYDDAKVRLNALPDNNASLVLETNGKSRWRVVKTNSTESGSNAGSDLTIQRWDDSGNYIGDVLLVTRSTGNMQIYTNLTIENGLSVANGLYADIIHPSDSIRYETNGKSRWRILKSGSETGSNVGSDFAISRWDDNGNYIDTPIYLRRDTGEYFFNSGAFQVAGTWQKPFKLGTTCLWVNSAGKLMIKSGTPSSDTDGTIVGTQS
ncbi:hypothetical protein [Heyndrickxia ginsengihumi]|uniref:hypothetical protein n=1 Tax=Heyndrickxia ginsengihumi TaxID=363870 RepID=UPI000472BFE0|nr:hypothetical protein [Heyndrickxia ginsengihumi]